MRDIAHALGRVVSTITYEITKNSAAGEYNPHKAQHKAYVRRHAASFRGKSVATYKELRSFVEKHLLAGQSPAGISGRIKNHEKFLPSISKDTIYRYLRSPYGIIVRLLLNKKKRPKLGAKRKDILERVFIDKRPKVIEKRGRVGDVEGDFIVSGRSGHGILLVVTCRKLRVSFLEVIHEISIDEVHRAFVKIKQRFPEMRSLTLDNDILFKMHKTLAELLKVKIYFCHPYHSWEKGGVENLNGFIRRYICKGSDLSRYNRTEIKLVEERCNARFLKCLDYFTPAEALARYRRKQKTAGKL